MCKFLGLFVLSFALLFLNGQANATGYHHYHHIVKVVTGGGSKSAVASGSSSQKFLCVANPAGVFICVVAVLIVGDEIRRTIEGPACATMKPRRSWFGKVKDEPRLWRPLCNWKDPQTKPKPVSVYG